MYIYQLIWLSSFNSWNDLCPKNAAGRCFIALWSCCMGLEEKCGICTTLQSCSVYAESFSLFSIVAYKWISVKFLSEWNSPARNLKTYPEIDICSGNFLFVGLVVLHKWSHIMQLMQGCFITANSSCKLRFAIFSKYTSLQKESRSSFCFLSSSGNCIF